MRGKINLVIRALFVLILFSIVSLFFCTDVYAVSTESYYPFDVLRSAGLSVISEKAINLKIDGLSYPPEITPTTHYENGYFTYLLPTSFSWVCRTQENAVLGAVNSISRSSCNVVTKPLIIKTIDPYGSPVFYDNNSQLPLGSDWKFSYDGILGGMVVVGNRVLTVRHGEQQNNILGSSVFQNRVFPNVLVSNCAAGQVNGVWQECWESYLGYLNFGWVENTASGWGTYHDEGPIVWPQIPTTVVNNTGNITKNAGGFRHPTIFTTQDYVYTFFTVNDGLPANTFPCVGAARAPISSLGLPGNWKNYYQGDFTESSLPVGFTKEIISNYYDDAGGKTGCIDRVDSQKDLAQWFFVAKLKNTPFYLAAEESSPGWTSWRMGLRLSTDLKHWSPVITLKTAPEVWGTGPYVYPVFYNSLGTSNYEIDAGDFYILGKQPRGGSSGYQTNLMKLKFSCPLLPVPSGFIVEKNGSTAALRWDNASDVAFYSLRIDDKSNGWNGSCDSSNPGDKCTDVVGNTYVFAFDPSHSYDIWIHSRSLCGSWSNSVLLITQISTPTPSPTVEPTITATPTKLGDINGDGVVNIQDYQLLSNSFGKSSTDQGFNSTADLNKDNTVNVQDYQLLSNNYGK